MKKYSVILLTLLMVGTAFAQNGAKETMNDNNTPLHLMKPEYRVGYGVSKAEEVKAVMDRVLRYIDSETPAISRRSMRRIRR